MISQFVKCGRRRGAAGVVIVLFALLLLALISMVGVVANLAYVRLLRTELQAAADAAALSGATALCGSSYCWERAQSVAAETINRHAVHGSISRDSAKLNLSTAAGTGPRWEDPSGTYTVDIQRGRWWPVGSAPAAITPPNSPPWFEAFEAAPGYEGENWQTQHPGIPPAVAANAVRVTLQRRGLHMLLLPFGPQYDLRASATAIGGDLYQPSVPIAPIALPVCAILDDSAEFSPREQCPYRRYFTRADRYCLDPFDDDNCGFLPDTNWEEMPLEANCQNKDWYAFDIYCSNVDPQTICPVSPCQTFMLCDPQDCDNGSPDIFDIDFFPLVAGWVQGFDGAPRLSQISKHYGVIGLPESAVPSGVAPSGIEQWIRTNILVTGNLVPAQIGEDFRVLPQGFTDSLTEKALWDHYLDPEIYYVTAGEKTTFGQMPLWYYNYPVGNDLGCVNPRRDYYTTPHCEGGAVWSPVANWAAGGPRLVSGMCNSMFPHHVYRSPEYISQNAGHFPIGWFAHDLINTWLKVSAGGTAAERNKSCSGFLNFMLEPMSAWEVSIPIIADKGAAAKPCTGMGSPKASVDPPIADDFNYKYQIIGFVKLQISDADIGRPPPITPRIMFSEITSWVSTFEKEYCNEIAAIPDNLWGFNVPPYQCPPAGDPQHEACLASTGGAGSVGFSGCNNMRGTMACKTGLVPSYQFASKPDPRLVD
ncbi:MAG TPA: pilus assembly protein TadG-related protein [Oligoflexia bacterium]|nr:pilus assembly protein TadG-related protein [Oligoflexia bacterium]